MSKRKSSPAAVKPKRVKTAADDEDDMDVSDQEDQLCRQVCFHADVTPVAVDPRSPHALQYDV